MILKRYIFVMELRILRFHKLKLAYRNFPLVQITSISKRERNWFRKERFLLTSISPIIFQKCMAISGVLVNADRVLSNAAFKSRDIRHDNNPKKAPVICHCGCSKNPIRETSS
jgi:hypothetical protein